MKTITAEQLNDVMEREDDWTLVDVLHREQYEKEHIPGAHNIPLQSDDFVDQVNELVDSEDGRVIVYCANDACELSPQAARKLERAGFDNVIDFEGGIEEWKEAGFEAASEIHEPLGN